MILLYYPQNTAPGMGRMPLSLLALGAVLEGRYEYRIIDGNVDRDARKTISALLRKDSGITMLAVSVMPGTQLSNAIRHCRDWKQAFPHVPIVWGGYFPTMHTGAVLNSSQVDFVIRGQGEKSFPELIDALKDNTPLARVHNLSYRENGKIINNPEHPIFDPNDRPPLPYHAVDMDAYAIHTFVGKRTLCHETSAGCPHKCNFCGVVDMFQSRWKPENPERTMEVLRHLKQRYGMDGIEFHDSDFFVSEKRVALLCEMMRDLNLQWWAEGRIDTLLNYGRETWNIMRRSGLKMIFFGAESGLDETLKLMDKGGVTTEKTKAIARLCKEYDVQSEFSFVMGSHPTKTKEDIDATIRLIYELETINPKSQMHPFIYTPVPFGNIFDAAVEGGLQYPKNLDEWISPEWTQYSLRNNPHTPWLTRRLYKKIVNFRAVHQSYYPKTNDRIVGTWKLMLLKAVSAWRYRLRFFSGAYELRVLLRLLINPSMKNRGF
jgi:anaerobic magnesium-protoporphyrin IX monomethyl ester cyclase